MPKRQAYQDPLRLGGRGADLLGESFDALDCFDIDKSTVTRAAQPVSRVFLGA